MAGGLVLGHIVAGAPLLMIALAVVARGAGMPNGHVISAGVAVVVVVVPFVGVGLRTGGCCWWDAGCGSSRSRRDGRRCWRVVGVASSSTSSSASSSSAPIGVALVGMGSWWGYCWSGGGEHC